MTPQELVTRTRELHRVHSDGDAKIPARLDAKYNLAEIAPQLADALDAAEAKLEAARVALEKIVNGGFPMALALAKDALATLKQP